MAIISQIQWDSIIKYIQGDLMAKTSLTVEEIVAIADRCTLRQWQLLQGKVKKIKPEVSKEVQEAFEIWWKGYPANSKLEYKDKKWPGDRTLRANKQVCLKLYNNAIIEIGKGWTDPVPTAASMICLALQVQLANIKIESYKTGQNKMQYMKNCETYLRQKAYEPWIGEPLPMDIVQEKKIVNTDVNI